jgi:diaminohydroxyphosphoribosylaminopyrimidine deaminase/5-amino-6-(5-phosphoribosylamino)uracil reductase
MDEKYMWRAVGLASLGLGNVAPNPCVGSVIVCDNRIIGEGFHRLYGTAHAEVNAVNSVRAEDRHLLPKSKIYVTLEPCHHYGKTPPCVDLILDNKIPKIVIGCKDPNPQVGGQSIEKLKQNGVEVTVGVLEKECWEVARRFMTFFIKKRPYIILKYAKSKDDFIGNPNEQVWITGGQSKSLVHKWRSEEAAILVGTNTAMIDNPNLTNRLWYGKNPLRLVIDTKEKLNPNLNIFNQKAETKIFKSDDIELILKELYDLKINSIIVEGGAALLNDFIKKGFWDEARIFTGDCYLKNGVIAPNFPKIKPAESQFIGRDRLEIFYK